MADRGREARLTACSGESENEEDEVAWLLPGPKSWRTTAAVHGDQGRKQDPRSGHARARHTWMLADTMLMVMPAHITIGAIGTVLVGITQQIRLKMVPNGSFLAKWFGIGWGGVDNFSEDVENIQNVYFLVKLFSYLNKSAYDGQNRIDLSDYLILFKGYQDFET